MKSVDVSAVSPALPIDSQVEVLRLFSEHGPSLFRFCRSTLGGASDAEDVVQETFLKLTALDLSVLGTITIAGIALAYWKFDRRDL
jgi:hypothetical protein